MKNNDKMLKSILSCTLYNCTYSSIYCTIYFSYYKEFDSYGALQHTAIVKSKATKHLGTDTLNKSNPQTLLQYI